MSTIRLICLFVLTCVVSMFPLTGHARTLTPDQVRTFVAKQGVGHGIAVLDKSGLELYGKILAIGPDRFSMQVLYAPQATEVFYADVQDVRTGFSSWTRGEKAALYAGIGGFVGFSVWTAVHFIHTKDEHAAQFNQNCAAMFGGTCPNPAVVRSDGLQFRFGR